MPRQPSTTTRKVAHQPSWRLAHDRIEAYLTRTGGHLGPVTFDLGRGRKVQPYSVAPWAEEKLGDDVPAILRVLRGDFFCMPFGGNAKPFRGERHPVHGETANADWTLQSLQREGDRTTLHASLATQIRPGRVDKRITLIDGHAALYCEHTLSDMAGPMSFGHHAMLRFPDTPGSGLISTSRFVHGQVYPGQLEDPAEGGYSMLKPGATFRSLQRVPTITGDTADLTRFPARRGYEDLVQIVNDPDRDVAWTAVSFPREGYVWFALKDPRELTGTIFWISNGGRHYAPWSGRHVNVMGLEEVTSYFHEGLATSAKKNPMKEMGYNTTVRLDRRRPFTVRYVMAVAPITRRFDHVRRINLKNGKAHLTSASGATTETPIAWPPPA